MNCKLRNSFVCDLVSSYGVARDKWVDTRNEHGENAGHKPAAQVCAWGERQAQLRSGSGESRMNIALMVTA